MTFARTNEVGLSEDGHRHTTMKHANPNQSDHQIIRGTLSGDKEMFGLLVHRYQNRLFNSMVQITRNEPEAEDVVQDAYVLAYSKLASYKGNSAFFTWLYRIAFNVAVSRMRRKRPTVSLQGKDEKSRLDFPDHAPPPDAKIRRDEEALQLKSALGRLSDEHRIILVLREMDELDYDAISEILELPIGTVRSRLHRARGRLGELLQTNID